MKLKKQTNTEPPVSVCQANMIDRQAETPPRCDWLDVSGPRHLLFNWFTEVTEAGDIGL